MNGSGQKQFRNWLGGRHQRVGERVSGHGRWENRKHPFKRPQRTKAVADTMETENWSMAMYSARLKGWKKQSANACIARILKSVARVWNPKEIQDKAIQEKVLAHLQAAERGLRRAEAAREKAGLAAFARVLGSLRLNSLDQVDNLRTLQEIVVALEG
ncbi:MAG: hypothetical protein DMG89_07855 [Acidobacteria bacterium]|nr:MAG: hypothetical protein DMG89_07855 [Acidobacteriota bacterium]